LVVWYRYLRFFPDGTFAYRTSPHTVARIARTLAPAAAEPAGRRGAAAAADGAAQHGRWRLDAGGRLLTAMRYANSAATEVRCRLGLRSTCRGAHNRLDIAQIVSYDAASGEAVPVPLDAGDVEVDGFERRASTRGMGVYVLVRDEDVATSVLNLPIDKMDLWLPG
jgi:F-box protein 9